MSDLPIPFIVGVPRSGTTLLRLMFDSHPDLCIPPETHFILELLQQNPDNMYDFIQLLEKTPTFPDFDIVPSDLIQFISLSENVDRFSLSKIVEKFYEFYAIRNNKKRFGDKTPAYLLAMPSIQHLFGGRVKFIHIIRDGRDVFLSLRGKWFGPGDDLIGTAIYWRSRIEQARRDSLFLQPDSYIEVMYEDLVRHPENILRELCKFVELDYSQKMNDYFITAPLKLNSLKDHPKASAIERKLLHKNTLNPPDVNLINKWKYVLNKEQVEQFNLHSGDLLKKLGYDLF